MHFKEYTVVGDNKLVQNTNIDFDFTAQFALSGINMTEFQLKFINYVISQIKPTDTKFYPVTKKFSELCSDFGITRGGNNDKNTKLAIKNLIKTCVYIEDDKHFVAHSWFSTLDFDKEEKTITAELNPALAPYLLDLYGKKQYFMYEFGNIASLKKKTSIILYQWLHSHLNHKAINISIKKLRENVFMYPKEKYAKTHDFIKYVIIPALTEINKNTDLIVEYKENYRKEDNNPNPKVVSLAFTIKQKPAPEYRQVKLNIWKIPDKELEEGESERNQVSAFLYHNKLKELANNNSLSDEIKVQSIAADLINKNQEKETKKKKEKKVAPSKGVLPFSNY